MAARRRPPRARRPLLVTDRGRPRTPRAFLQRVVRAALAQGGRPGLPVSILLTDDAGIAEVHGRFLGDPSATDVIAFDLGDGAEVVVSVETAARVARAHGYRIRDEVALYVVHGLLHVCGHDDHRAAARRRMRTAEAAVLARLGLSVSTVDG